MMEAFQYIVISVIFLSATAVMILGTIDTARDLKRFKESQKGQKQ